MTKDTLSPVNKLESNQHDFAQPSVNPNELDDSLDHQIGDSNYKGRNIDKELDKIIEMSSVVHEQSSKKNFNRTEQIDHSTEKGNSLAVNEASIAPTIMIEYVESTNGNDSPDEVLKNIARQIEMSETHSRKLARSNPTENSTSGLSDNSKYDFKRRKRMRRSHSKREKLNSTIIDSNFTIFKKIAGEE